MPKGRLAKAIKNKSSKTDGDSEAQHRLILPCSKQYISYNMKTLEKLVTLHKKCCAHCRDENYQIPPHRDMFEINPNDRNVEKKAHNHTLNTLKDPMFAPSYSPFYY